MGVPAKTRLAGVSALAIVLTLPVWARAQSELSVRRPVLGAPQAQPPSPVEKLPLPSAAPAELSLEALVEEVLARNPGLPQMIAAWQAASARIPQVTSWDDPMLGGTLAPAAPGSPVVNDGYRLEIAQKIPFPGKLRLRGDNARAEAAAAASDVDDVRLQLIEAAKNAYFDYYLVARALEVNQDNLKRLGQFKTNAESRYKFGKAPLQDLLQAEVDLGKARERTLELEQLLEVARARLNTLLLLPPDNPLPPAISRLGLEAPLPPARALRQLALERRPDLQALSQRLAAEEVGLGLARKEYFPDFEAMAGYDAFWQEKDLRAMIGVRVNLPIRFARREGAVAEALAKIAQRNAELSRKLAEVEFEVQQSHAQVQKADKSVRLYQETILPKAEDNVKSAQTAYVAGQIPFLALVEAQRNVIALRDRYYELLADYHRRRASLERVTGGLLPVAP